MEFHFFVLGWITAGCNFRLDFFGGFGIGFGGFFVVPGMVQLLIDVSIKILSEERSFEEQLKHSRVDPLKKN
jgi:hypothetical protein